MQGLFGFLSFAVIIALVVALIRPRWIFLRDVSRGKAAAILGGALLATVVVGSRIAPPEKTGQAGSNPAESSQSKASDQGVGEEQLQAALEAVKAEKNVRDATWAPLSTPQAPMLWAAVQDDGSNRDGYAEYLCTVLCDSGVKNAAVVIKDYEKSLRGEWVNLGQANCPCESERG